MLSEKGMVAALKAAYKGGGYKAAFAEGKVMLRCGKTCQNNPGQARIEGFPWLGEGGG